MRILEPPPGLPEGTTPTCRSCHQPIRWAVNQATGKRIPLDLEPAPDGNIVETGRTHSTGAPMIRFLKRAETITFPSLALVVGGHEENPPRYVTHFATCEFADRHRRR